MATPLNMVGSRFVFAEIKTKIMKINAMLTLCPLNSFQTLSVPEFDKIGAKNKKKMVYNHKATPIITHQKKETNEIANPAPKIINDKIQLYTLNMPPPINVPTANNPPKNGDMVNM